MKNKFLLGIFASLALLSVPCVTFSMDEPEYSDDDMMEMEVLGESGDDVNYDDEMPEGEDDFVFEEDEMMPEEYEDAIE